MNKKQFFMYLCRKPKLPVWYTVFEGSKKINCGGSGTTTWISNLPTNVQKFRATGKVILTPAISGGDATITATVTGVGTTYSKTYTGSSSQTVNFSDVEFTTLTQTSEGSSNSSYTTIIKYNSTDGTLNISLGGGTSSYSGSLTITKIEALY